MVCFIYPVYLSAVISCLTVRKMSYCTLKTLKKNEKRQCRHGGLCMEIIILMLNAKIFLRCFLLALYNIVSLPTNLTK
jgi:hypothetical protein